MPFFISMSASSVATGVYLAATVNAALLGVFATW
ncbi:putative membrane protein [Wolbachia endosymbiont of Brugia pahangi]|nr:putative membrane protein [Wolbachia endosymbiont of Brugia pahangi]